MNRFGRHDGDAPGSQSDALHAFHTGQYAPLDDDELFFGRVVMSRHAAARGRLEKEGRRARIRIPILDRALQTFDIIVLDEGRVLERRDGRPQGPGDCP
jgi:hypothetical protein